jgi:hypothetical protein
LRTPATSIAAIGSALDRPGGEALDEVSLDEDEEQAGRNQRQNACRHHLPEVDGKFPTKDRRPTGKVCLAALEISISAKSSSLQAAVKTKPERRAEARQA